MTVFCDKTGENRIPILPQYCGLVTTVNQIILQWQTSIINNNLVCKKCKKD